MRGSQRIVRRRSAPCQGALTLSARQTYNRWCGGTRSPQRTAAMRRSRLGLSFGDVLDLNLLLDDEPPASTDVVVIPQDVHLLLGELTALEEPPETKAELLAAALRQRPRRRGTLVVPPPRRGEPLVLQAIVYDFDDTPPARELHVFEVLLAAFEEAKARGLGS